jgi:TonB family protein
MKIKHSILTVLLSAIAAGSAAQTLQYDFKEWVAAHLDYPQAAYETMFEVSIPVSFKVAADGAIFDAACPANLRHESRMMQEMVRAAVEAVASAPKWEPAGSDYSPEEYSLMVEFQMPKFVRDVESNPAFLRPEGVTEEKEYDSNKRLRKWIASQLPVPEDFRVSLTGIVEKGGTLGHLKVVSTSDEETAAKVVATLETAPKWTPALDRGGEAVRAFKYIAMSFDDDGNNIEDDGEIVMPTFRGGDLDKFRNWVMDRVVYPQKAFLHGIQGVVLLRFVVDTDGSVVDIEVLHSPNSLLAEMAVKAVGSSPKWTPAIDTDGKPRKIYYLLPMLFVI